MKAEPADLLALPDVDPLQGLMPSLALLATGLSGGPMTVQDQAGDVERAVLTREGRLLLTARQMPDQAAPSHALYRAAVAHAVAHWRFSRPGLPTHTLKPMGLAVVSAVEDARVDRLLAQAYPGVRRWFIDHLARVPDPKDFSFAALVARMDRALLDLTYADDNHWVNKARRLFEEKLAGRKTPGASRSCWSGARTCSPQRSGRTMLLAGLWHSWRWRRVAGCKPALRSADLQSAARQN